MHVERSCYYLPKNTSFYYNLAEKRILSILCKCMCIPLNRKPWVKTSNRKEQNEQMVTLWVINSCSGRPLWWTVDLYDRRALHQAEVSSDVRALGSDYEGQGFRPHQKRQTFISIIDPSQSARSRTHNRKQSVDSNMT